MRAVVDHRGAGDPHRRPARPLEHPQLGPRRRASARSPASSWRPCSSSTCRPSRLLVVNAYAAAMVGRLRSVPLTFVGAMVLGLAESYAVGYLPSDGAFTNLRLAIPTIILFLALLADPRGPAPRRLHGRRPHAAAGQPAALPAGRRRARRPSPAPSRRSTSEATLSKVRARARARADRAVARPADRLGRSGVPVPDDLRRPRRLRDGEGRGRRRARSACSPRSLVAAPVGALVALPALRLQGLYLALATLAFAVLMDNVFFIRADVFGNLGAVRVERLEIAGRLLRGRARLLHAARHRVRRRRRRPARPPAGTASGGGSSALRDSQVACTMMGLDTTVTKVQVFALSSAIAARRRRAATPVSARRATAGDYEMFYSLPLVLLAVLGGITAVSGALVGGLVLAGFPVLADNVSSSRPRHPRTRAHRHHPGPPARRSRALALRHVARAAEAPCGPTMTPLPDARRGARRRASPSTRAPPGPRPSVGDRRCLSPTSPPSGTAGARAARPAGGLRPHRGAARDRPGRAARAPSSGCSDRTAPARRTTLAAISGQLSPTGGSVR